MAKRCCENCVNSLRPTGRWYRLALRNWPGLLTCLTHPDALGRMVGVSRRGICPNFHPRREPPLRPTLPEPPDEGVRLIPLTRGRFAVVDAGDYEWLSKYKWHVVAPRKMYAGRKEGGRTIYMHRQIMQPPPGMMVDHIDGNSLDNRRANLRICTNQQNMQNLRKSPGGRSAYKGVYYDKRRRTWSAKICHNGRSRHLGTFATEIEAARAYDRKARELFGDFARPNLPDEVGPGAGA